jgi:GNAT superfamily N-acetyltransferase
MAQYSTRTYLEMRQPSDLWPAAVPALQPRIERVGDCPPAFWRFLYTEVGRKYHWFDRLPWTDDQIRQYLDDPAVSLYVMWVDGAPAGYFELHVEPDRAVEIVYFGLLDEFTGRGLGGHMLGEAVKTAWAQGASRVWLHTNTLDHPAALPNYQKRGFRITRTEVYDVKTGAVCEPGPAIGPTERS